MIRRQFASTDLTISAVGFGAWAIGGWLWGEQDDRDSVSAIHAALDAGVNWIDTAPIYGSGRSERVVGEALRALPASRRPHVFTKFGLGADSAQARKSATRAEIRAECEASLQRLGVERIDLLQLHWPVPQPVEEVAAACDELLRAGSIGAVGVCNYDVAQLEAWKATGKPLNGLQAPYSLFRPKAADTVLPWCEANGIGAIAYSPLFRGMLFGTWGPDKTFAAGDSRGQHKDYRGRRFLRHLQAIEEIRAVGAEEELSVAQLAIGALMGTPGLTGCIVGARNAAQGAALGELGRPLTAKQLTAIEAITARLDADLAGIPEEPAA
jgi:aryl-alcohol dehydrogenase-like predicted oxidoreductase